MQPRTTIVASRILVEIMQWQKISTYEIKKMVFKRRINNGIHVQKMKVSLHTLIIILSLLISINLMQTKIYQTTTTHPLAEIKR